jgi:HAD superfamily hydrolase (TIGR01459 family)
MPAPPVPLGSLRPSAGLQGLAERFGWFVIDQWGCLHDGHRLHPGALPVLEGLAAAGKPVALVSNSSLGEAPSRRLLRGLGVADWLYGALVTAGSAAEAWLRARRDAGARLRVFSLMGPPGPDAVLRRLDLPLAPTPEVADLVVAAGIVPPTAPPDRDLLRRCIERDLPLLCLNPDRVSLQPDGSLWLCPGSFADAYAALGGQVQRWGKPDPVLYRAAHQLLGGPEGPGLGVGDSLEHDVLGAHAAGLSSCFITSGVHGAALSDSPSSVVDPARLHALCRQLGAWPDFVATRLAW